MVIAQAATVGVVGYAIGVGFSTLIGVLFRGRDMPYQPQWWTLAASASAMILVCCIAAVASLRGVLKLEPGGVFKA
jgi:putative ABC transport system permease protein